MPVARGLRVQEGGVMIHVADKLQVSWLNGDKELVAEASELGLEPGYWPEFIALLDDKNEGFLFMRNERIEDGGYRYRTRSGAVPLTVFND